MQNLLNTDTPELDPYHQQQQQMYEQQIPTQEWQYQQQVADQQWQQEQYETNQIQQQANQYQERKFFF